jgi:hypothetical protein
VCATLVGALVEAVHTVSDRAGPGQERCSSQALARPANVSMRDLRRVGLVHEHRALLVPRLRRHELAAADVDHDAEGRTRLSVMLWGAKENAVVKFTARYIWLSRGQIKNLGACDVEDERTTT